MRLTKRGGVYYFRRRDPRAEAAEVSLSLGTRAYRFAEWLARCLDARMSEVLRESPEITLDGVRAVLRANLRELTHGQDDRQVRDQGSIQDQVEDLAKRGKRSASPAFRRG